jgi:hypothetical protein
MASCDLVGNLGQRRIARTGVLKPVLGHRDGVSAAVPFANQTRAGLETEARGCPNPARGSQARIKMTTGRSVCS